MRYLMSTIMRGVLPVTVWLMVMTLPSVALGQGFLLDTRPDRDFRLPRPHPHPHPRPIPRPVPQPPQSYKIKEIAVEVKLSDQIAKVHVSQSFVNTGSRQMEVRFVFPLSYDGAVDRLTLLVDGKEYQAKLLGAKEARRIYEGYIRRNQDPALMEWLGGGMFQTSVFPVPPGAERTVMLRYTQLCRKSGPLTELLFPFRAAKYTSHPVEKVRVNVAVDSRAKIKNVYSPSHSIDVSRPDDQHAVVKYSSANEVPMSDFRLLYDTSEQKVGASVLSYKPSHDDQGYLLMLLSPEIRRPGKSDADSTTGAKGASTAKTVIFAVDRSGSMSGKKIEQAKASLQFVLNNLHQGDQFNIVAYDSKVESFRAELQPFNERTRRQALGFVEGIYAGGATNIDGALQAALGQLKDDQRPSYVIFLTDGLPTVGESKEPQIVTNVQKNNKVRARIFSLGVGYDVNSRLLDKLARAGFGQTEYVRPNEDIEARVSKLYNRIGAPVMTDVKVTVDMEGFGEEQGSPVSRLYPSGAYDLFAEDQLVIAGRYKSAGAAKVRVSGMIDGERRTFDFPAKLTAARMDSADAPADAFDETYAYVAKVWALRRIGEIIDQIDLHGKNKELIDELVALSTEHGILTPYTSFLADENSNLRDLAGNRRRADEALSKLAAEAGQDAFAQRAAKGRLRRAAQAPAAGAAVVLDLKEDKDVEIQAVKNIGAKTFFLRGQRWVDSALTPAQERNVRKIKRFSEEYFDLIEKHGPAAAKYLAIEGNVTVVLDGQAYAF